MIIVSISLYLRKVSSIEIYLYHVYIILYILLANFLASIFLPYSWYALKLCYMDVKRNNVFDNDMWTMCYGRHTHGWYNYICQSLTLCISLPLSVSLNLNHNLVHIWCYTYINNNENTMRRRRRKRCRCNFI